MNTYKTGRHDTYEKADLQILKNEFEVPQYKGEQKNATSAYDSQYLQYLAEKIAGKTNNMLSGRKNTQNFSSISSLDKNRAFELRKNESLKKINGPTSSMPDIMSL